MLSKFKKSNDFIKNSITLVLGSGFSQVIPLAFSPILSRVFSPTEFGILAFFMACTSIATLFATGYYENAIVIPKDDNTSLNLVGLIATISSVISLLILVFIVLCYSFNFSFLFNYIEFKYLIILPAAIFLNANYLSLINWLNRFKKYKLISKVKITQTAATVFISLILGLVGFKSEGLIIGYVSGFFLAIIPLFFLLYKEKEQITLLKIKESSLKFISYPKLLMPSSIINTGASQSPVFFMTKYFEQKIVGSFSFALRILNAPIAIISTSVGQVFFKTISENSNNGDKSILTVFIETGKLLFAASFLTFIPFFLFGESIFVFIFGDEWSSSGSYVEILSLSLFVKFVASPLSVVFLVLEKLKKLATWQTLYFIIIVTVFIISKDEDVVTVLWRYVITDIIMYLIYLVMMYKVIKTKDKQFIKV